MHGYGPKRNRNLRTKLNYRLPLRSQIGHLVENTWDRFKELYKGSENGTDIETTPTEGLVRTCSLNSLVDFLLKLKYKHSL